MGSAMWRWVRKLRAERRAQLECGGGIATHGMEFDGEIGALVLEQQRFVARRCAAICDRGQGIDLASISPKASSAMPAVSASTSAKASPT